MKLRDLLRHVDADGHAKLEVMSGRRARVVKGNDVVNLGDEILSDEEVIALAQESGAGSRVDDLSDRPVAWVVTGPRPLTAALQMKGREVLLTIVAANRPAAEAAKPTSAEPARGGAAPAAKAEARTDPRADARMDSRRPSKTTTRRPSREMRSMSRSKLEAVRGAADSKGQRPLEPQRPPVKVEVDFDRSGSRPQPPAQQPAPQGPAGAPAKPGPAPQQPAPQQPAPQQPAPQQLPAPQQAAPKLALPEQNIPPPAPTPGVSEPSNIRYDLATAQRDALLFELVREAQKRNASDLHFSTGTVPQVRTLRGLEALGGRRELLPNDAERLLAALCSDEQRKDLEATGGTNFGTTLERAARLRVNISKTLTGLKFALRLLPLQAPSPAQLELPAEIERATRHHQGLVLITGPAGHGKTTTMAALVDAISTQRACHVIIVEDPCEILIASKKAVVSQREVGRHAKSFERALKGALRQDPDVIVVGELRDAETVRIALSASETGHLVLGTMNTPTTKAAIDRLIDLFPPSDQPQVRATLAGGLRMVVNQRLVPRANGQGRIAACEMLPGSVALWNLIREDKLFQISSLMQRGRGAGILRLAETLSDFVRMGWVDVEDARAVMPDPTELDEIMGVKRAQMQGAQGPGAPIPVAQKPGAIPPPAPAQGPSFPGAPPGLYNNPAAAQPPPEEESSLGSLLNKAGAFFSRNKGGS